MRIGELARASGVSASRIRFYEKNRVLPPPDRRANGYRDYPAERVAVLRFIDGAQALGFTLAELGVVFARTNAALPSPDAMIAGLEQKYDELSRHIRAATARRREVATLIAELRKCAVAIDPTASRTGNHCDDSGAGVRRVPGGGATSSR